MGEKGIRSFYQSLIPSSPAKGGKGFQGNVILVSPSGDQAIKINVPGRVKKKTGLEVDEGWASSRRPRVVKNRQDRRFRKLLSLGWRIATPDDLIKIGKVEKKNTTLVNGTKKTGDASHGGDHASGEIKDSPNKSNEGEKKRGCRGGEKNSLQTLKGEGSGGKAKKSGSGSSENSSSSGKNGFNNRGNRGGRGKSQYKNKKEKSQRLRLQVQKTSQTGSVGVYTPQPLEVTPALLRSAEESAENLAQLVGRSAKKVKRGVTIDVNRLLVALETGDDPLPALEAKDEKPKLRILVTPDCSGSCQSWSGLSQAWALHLSKIPEVDVIYLTNFNGELWDVTKDDEVQKIINSVDVVIYLGDGDGDELCRKYAEMGAVVVALDSYCATYENPRLKRIKDVKNGSLFWVSSVSANAPHTWKTAINLCLGR